MSETLKKSLRIIIALSVVFVLLLVGYFVFVRPMLEDDEVVQSVVYSPIWESEVASSGGKVLMYPHYERSEISKITVHNPDNAKFGDQYVDWGFTKYTGPEDNDEGLIPDDFYLDGYEYAPFSAEALANLVVGAGYTLATARVEDHCTDYSRYGLDYATPEEAISVTLTLMDGKIYTYYIGDKTPSGSGYYIRVVGEDKLLSTGEMQERDSVYTVAPANLEAAVLRSPVEIVTPTLTLPVDTQSQTLLDSFRIWINEPEYIVKDEDGKNVIRPAIYLKPLDESKDPFALFSGLSVYYAESHPGYFGSSRFEELNSVFADFQGSEVVELATQSISEEDGEPIYTFDAETQKKYHLDDPYYTLCYRYQGIDNYVYFSPLQENSYYYAYSLTFNTICKVMAEEVYFLTWDLQAYLQNHLIYVNIDKCDSLKITGKYDFWKVDADGAQKIDINEAYQLTGSGQNLVINTADGKTLDTKQFRNFYQILISISNRGMLSAEEVKEAMKGEAVATFEATTRRTVVYKTDEQGNNTNEVDYVLESVTKIYRFYKTAGDSGRLLCTIQQIDPEGNASEETGSFYVLDSRLHQLFEAMISLENGTPIDKYERF